MKHENHTRWTATAAIAAALAFSTTPLAAQSIDAPAPAAPTIQTPPAPPVAATPAPTVVVPDVAPAPAVTPDQPALEASTPAATGASDTVAPVAADHSHHANSSNPHRHGVARRASGHGRETGRGYASAGQRRRAAPGAIGRHHDNHRDRASAAGRRTHAGANQQRHRHARRGLARPASAGDPRRGPAVLAPPPSGRDRHGRRPARDDARSSTTRSSRNRLPNPWPRRCRWPRRR